MQFTPSHIVYGIHWNVSELNGALHTVSRRALIDECRKQTMMYYDITTNMEQMIPEGLRARLSELALNDKEIRLFCGYIAMNDKNLSVYTVERLILGRGYDRDADNYVCWAAREFKLDAEKLNPYYDQYR